jgi:hypothetical protein
VFWLTSAINALALMAGASLLVFGAGRGPSEFGWVWLSLLVVAPLTTLIAASTAAAVLLYHAIAFWIRSLGSTGA